MLFLLTGDMQIGKTRWLMRTLLTLEEHGVPLGGVLTPGIWRHRCAEELAQAGESADAREYEKLGIDAILLPSRERIFFARPALIGATADDCAQASQSRAAKLAWDISDDAIGAINAHFDALAADDSAAGPGLLVIDELGRLELERDGGLTSALRMVDAGPTNAFPHALAIVRASLLDIAHERFAPAWDGRILDISPDGESAERLLSIVAPAD